MLLGDHSLDQRRSGFDSRIPQEWYFYQVRFRILRRLPSMNNEDEADILETLKDWSEDDHRNYVYPEQAQALLALIKKRDEEIASLTARLTDSDGLIDRLAAATRPINQTETE